MKLTKEQYEKTFEEACKMLNKLAADQNFFLRGTIVFSGYNEDHLGDSYIYSFHNDKNVY